MKVSTLRTWTWATIAQGPGMLVFFPNNPSMQVASVSSTWGLLSCSWTGLSWKPVWVKTVIQNSVYTCIKLSKNSKKKVDSRYQPLSLWSMTTGQSSWLAGTQEHRDFHVHFLHLHSTVLRLGELFPQALQKILVNRLKREIYAVVFCIRNKKCCLVPNVTVMWS